jgi:hypothetical protein
MNPILLYMNIPGDSKLPLIYTTFAQEFQKHNKTMTILHLSDEAGTDPIDFYESPAIRYVFRNYPRDTLPVNKTLVLPLGYANGRGGISETTPAFKDRPYLWSFAGSMDRLDRDKAVLTLQSTGDCVVYAKTGWSDPPKLQAAEYTQLLQESKFIPCFAGFRALESYRLYEALEHGAIPFYVPDKGADGIRDTYTMVLGKHPILSFPSWDKAAELLPLFAKNPVQMEEHRTTLKTWWSMKKAELQQTVKAALPN